MKSWLQGAQRGERSPRCDQAAKSRVTFDPREALWASGNRMCSACLKGKMPPEAKRSIISGHVG